MKNAINHSRRSGKKPCPRCGDGVIWDRELNDDAEPVWACRCCGHEDPRQVRRSKKQREFDAILQGLIGDEE